MKKHLSLSKVTRKIHHWGSIIIAVQLAIVLVTGVLLLLKKEFNWVQPPTLKGEQQGLEIEFPRILDIVKTVPEAGISSWSDVDRLDVRPGKGMLKVRAENHWEIQIDTHSDEVLQVAYRRSDIIESIHDGSFFHDSFKLLVFLPSAILFTGVWASGIYLFIYPYLNRRNRRKR